MGTRVLSTIFLKRLTIRLEAGCILLRVTCKASEKLLFALPALRLKRSERMS